VRARESAEALGTVQATVSQENDQLIAQVAWVIGTAHNWTGPCPSSGCACSNKRPESQPWEVRWVRWPDFGLPTDRQDAQLALREAWHRAADERVELACGGGRGRTGTALACLAVLDGVPPAEAVAYVREHYDPRAVETPWQRRYVTRFTTS